MGDVAWQESWWWNDEQLLVKGLKHSLEAGGYEVLAAYDGREALDLLKTVCSN